MNVRGSNRYSHKALNVSPLGQVAWHRRRHRKSAHDWRDNHSASGSMTVQRPMQRESRDHMRRCPECR